MTNSGQTTESEAKNTALAIDDTVDTAQSVPAESGHEHMRTIGRFLYDIIQDWQQQRQNDTRGQSEHPEQEFPKESEGRQA